MDGLIECSIKNNINDSLLGCSLSSMVKNGKEPRNGTKKKLKNKKKQTSPGRLELPTSRLTVGRANRLRHGDLFDKRPRTFCNYKQDPTTMSYDSQQL
ncbi:hypothetical protein ACN38_g6354 [Penicillium nordicum]|uniref:Uncharacterized protein n=1 Tax=Penicillium nordicum TaxID=229535 RepID=A0A0N0RYR3_9EURO|nr:hypothetical protein ACN38_g6354 [Penicillium nordicum]